MSSLVKHLRLSLRTLSRHPRFALLAVLYLTLGLGVNTLIFSVFKSVLLEPLPFAEPDRLALIFDYYNEAAGGSTDDAMVTPWNYLTRHQRCQTFEGMAAIERRSFFFDDREEGASFTGAAVSANLMPLLGVDVFKGRHFRPEEDRPGNTRVVMLSYDLWQRQLGGDEGWLGRPLKLNGEIYTVIGILPAGFYDPIVEAELWVPLGLDPADDSEPQRKRHSLFTVGRLVEGVALDEARAELAVISEQMAQEYPRTHVDWVARAYPLTEQLIGDAKTPLLALQAAAGFVWLIACVNMANLLLIRLLERRHELALRLALGANRRALAGHGLSEGMLLAGIAGILGLLAADLVFGLLPDLGPLVDFPAAVQRLGGIDASVVAFTVLLTLLTGLFLGLVPALRPITARLYEHLTVGGRSSPSRRQRRFFDALVVIEIALAMSLLIGAGLMLQSLQCLQRIDAGFDLQNTLVARFELPAHRYSDGVRRSAFVNSLTDRVTALPGIREAGVTTALPMSSDNFLGTFRISGRAPLSPSEMLFARYSLVSPGFLGAMGIPLLDGRLLSPGDDAEASGVVVISRNLAEQYWPGQDPIGHQLQRGQHPKTDDDPKLTVVGVVGDIRYDSVRRTKQPSYYFPYPQHAELDDLATQLSLVVLTEDEPRQLLGTLKRTIREIDPSLAIQYLSTYEELRARSFFRWRFLALLLTVFAACALLLSLLGIYGVMSYAVSQQTREMGVRMALGASSRAVLGLVLKRGLMIVSSGLVLGWAGAGVLSRYLRSLFFEVRTLEPSVFMAAGLVLFVVAMLACYLPARRAAAVDPINALHYE